MKRRLVLAIGDRPSSKEIDASSFDSFIRKRSLFSKRSLELRSLSYEDVLNGRLPESSGEPVIAMFFFPYRYWNEKIELYKYDDRIYGDLTFGREFKSLFRQVGSRLRGAYRANGLAYVNPPDAIPVDRDKVATKRLFEKRGVKTPGSFRIRRVGQVVDILERDIGLYVKPRFGSMGKGITFLSKERWCTNFIYRGGRIISRRSDLGWKFRDVTGRYDFLKKLIRPDFLWEETVSAPVIKGRKVSLRIYVVYKKIPYFYVRAESPDPFDNNWGCGKKIECGPILSRIPKEALRSAKGGALKAAAALGENYLGLDILFSKDFKETYVIDAHSFPSRERGFDLLAFLIANL